jgi:hypothetical protein
MPHEVTEKMIRAAQAATRCDPAECDECIAAAIAAALALLDAEDVPAEHDDPTVMTREVTDEMYKAFERGSDSVEITDARTPDERYILRRKTGIAAVLALLDAAGDAKPKHEPRRGSDVEAWLKAKRDEMNTEDGDPSVHWFTVDAILDDYRLHADTGTPLDSTENMGPTTAGVTDDA